MKFKEDWNNFLSNQYIFQVIIIFQRYEIGKSEVPQIILVFSLYKMKKKKKGVLRKKRENVNSLQRLEKKEVYEDMV